MAILARAVVANSTLTDFCVDDCQLTDASASVLAQLMRDNRANGGSLRRLDFEENKISADGERTVAEAMVECGMRVFEQHGSIC